MAFRTAPPSELDAELIPAPRLRRRALPLCDDCGCPLDAPRPTPAGVTGRRCRVCLHWTPGAATPANVVVRSLGTRTHA